MGVNFITMKYTRTPSSGGTVVDEPDGRNFLVYFAAGMDYPVIPNLGLGIEFRYVWGSYNQILSGVGDGLTANVSVDGPQVYFTMKYLF